MLISIIWHCFSIPKAIMLWWTASKIVPPIPASWCPLPYGIPSPAVLNGLCDLLLPNRIWQMWWDATVTPDYKSLNSSLNSTSLASCSLAPMSELPCCELPCGKAHNAGNWGWPPASSPSGAESCQQTPQWARKWILWHLCHFCRPASTLIAACEGLWAGDLLESSGAQIPYLQKLWADKYCCAKLPSFGSNLLHNN